VSHELATGLQAGLVAAGVSLALVGALAAADRLRRPVPVGGVAVVVAALVVLVAGDGLPSALVVALAGVGAVCSIGRLRRSRVVATALAVPFAVLLAWSVDELPLWIRALVALAASAGAVAAAHTDEIWRRPAIAPVLLAITAAAVFYAVPDTEEAAALLGVALPVALLGWPFDLVSLGGGGAGAAIVLVAWTSAVGARGDPVSCVGALASIALLAGLSLGHGAQRSRDATLRSRRVPIAAWSVAVFAISAQALLALLAARGGAAGAGAGRAAVLAVVVTIASMGVGAVLHPPD
jgi:hypothetical protein